MIVKQQKDPGQEVGKSEPPSSEDEPEDVGDDTQPLEPRRTWDQHPTEGPERVTGKLERLHTEGDADDRDAEDGPASRGATRIRRGGVEQPSQARRVPGRRKAQDFLPYGVLPGPRRSRRLHHLFTTRSQPFSPLRGGATATLASMHQRERRTVGIRPVPRLVLLLLALAALTLGAAGCGREEDDDGRRADDDRGCRRDDTEEAPRSFRATSIDRRLEHGRPADDGGRRGLPRRAARTSTSSVGISGTGGGFERFCAGETDISNASRPIDDEEEVPLCAEAGIEYTEFQVGVDALTVVVNPENDWVDLPDGRAAQDDLGAGGRGQDHELEPGRPELPGQELDARRPGHRLRDVRLLHRRDQRRGGREPRRLQRERGRQRHRPGGRGRAGRPRLPRLHVLRGEHGHAEGPRGRRRRRLRRAERRDGPGRHLHAALRVRSSST